MADSTHEGKDILKDKVAEYKRSHPDKLPELDFALLLKSLDKVNGNSEVKVARNAINDKREWIPGTKAYSVSKVYLSDDRKVVFSLRKDGGAMTVDQLREALEPIIKKLPVKTVPIMLSLGENKLIQLTELYAHSLVQSMWAGLPFDFVLGYNQDTKKRTEDSKPEEE